MISQWLRWNRRIHLPSPYVDTRSKLFCEQLTDLMLTILIPCQVDVFVRERDYVCSGSDSNASLVERVSSPSLSPNDTDLVTDMLSLPSHVMES
jgi:hypothetical protein